VSRLDSFIRRMSAQRDCLNHAATLIAGIAGPVLELGLGNGRTYDHLRALMPEREIYVFDRRIAAHPDCIPDDDHMFLGDIHDTLPAARARLGRVAALAHTDIGTGVKEDNLKLAAWLGPELAGLVAPGGVIVSDQRLPEDGLTALPLPEGVPENRLYLYRVDR
jgi:hypothetical protein